MPVSPSWQWLQALRRAGSPLLSLPLAGCVALVISSADYEPIDVTLKTQEEVVAALGEPVRRTGNKDAQTWFYRLQRVGLAGKPVQATNSFGALVVVPAWSTTNYEDNVKFEFTGDRLIAAHERFERGSGGGCGLFMGHGVQGACGVSGAKSPPTVADPDPKHQAHANATSAEFTLRTLPDDCARPAWNAAEAACLAARLIRGRAAAEATITVRILDRGDYFLVLPGAGTVAIDVGYPELRVVKQTGVAAAWRQPDAPRNNRTPSPAP